MSDTQTLLNKIAALRQRLEHAAVLAQKVGEDGSSLMPETREGTGRIQQLEKQVRDGARDSTALASSIRQLVDSRSAPAEAACWPTRLTFRARQILERGRELLARLRTLSD